MFNKKTNRICKKKFAINTYLKNKKSTNINKFLLKNKKISLLKKYMQSVDKKTLIRGGKNICSVTGKYKSVFNSLKISRHIINKLGNTSKLPNYSKLSW